MSRNGTSDPMPGSSADVRCPSCAAAVAPDWDWCHNCGYDPDALRPPHPQAATPTSAVPPTTASTAGGTDRTNKAMTAMLQARARARSGGPPELDLRSGRSASPSVGQAAPADAGGSGFARLPTVGAGSVVAAASENGTAAVDPWPMNGGRSKRPSHRMRWIVGIGLGLVLAVGAWIVLGRGSSPATQSRNLSQRLLEPSDLRRPGWSSVPPTRPLATSPMACIGQIPGTTDPKAKVVSATTAMRSSAGLPYVIEDVATFTTSEAKSTFDQLLGATLHGCPGTSPFPTAITRTGAPARPSVLARELTGDESAAFAVPLRDGTVDAVLIARFGGKLMLLQVVSDGAVDLPVLHLAAQGAAGRLAP